MKTDLTHCPMCKEKIDSFATCRADEPFTAKEPMEGLDDWGAYSAEKELLCFDGKYVHFRFLGDNSTRLVELKKFDLEAIRKAQALEQQQYHTCEHEGCTHEGSAYYIRPFDEEANGWYCDEHAEEAGFCWGCHLFCAGTEDFDFGTGGLCGGCQEAFDDETEDYYDEEADFGWDYNDNWFDPDMDLENEESNGAYIGPGNRTDEFYEAMDEHFENGGDE